MRGYGMPLILLLTRGILKVENKGCVTGNYQQRPIKAQLFFRQVSYFMQIISWFKFIGQRLCQLIVGYSDGF